MSLTGDWEDVYINAAGVRVEDAPGVTTEVTGGSAGLGTGSGVAGDLDGFVIKNVWITDLRDDAIKDYDAIGGTISDSLFDGVFSGISLGDGDVDGSDNVGARSTACCCAASLPLQGRGDPRLAAQAGQGQPPTSP